MKNFAEDVKQLSDEDLCDLAEAIYEWEFQDDKNEFYVAFNELRRRFLEENEASDIPL